MSRFSMAYAIQCHRNPNQINILIDVLDDEDVDFFLHVDKKSNIEQDISKQTNFYFVKENTSVTWGHYSQIDCTMRIFKEQTQEYLLVPMLPTYATRRKPSDLERSILSRRNFLRIGS